MQPTNFGRAIVAALCLAACGAAHAQFPVRAVTLVVPFPPGEPIDACARLLAERLTERWGRATLVDNRPGSGGVAGAQWVARAKADGYTLLMGNLRTQAINPSLHKTLPYDADKAFTPVSLVAELPLVVVVHPSLHVKSLRELIGIAKAKPGQLAYSSSGSGGASHLAAELFESMTGLRLFHVPEKGEVRAISELVAGRVNLSFATLAASIDPIRSGAVRPLATTGAQRLDGLPGLPTVAESGVPGYVAPAWIGLLAPAGTPAPIVDRISRDVRTVVAASDLRHKLNEQGAIPVGSSPAQFQARIGRDRARYARLIEEKGITAD